jgi:hypothetical protein
MNENFRDGFEKVANLETIGLLAALGGLGALGGHEMHVAKKIIHARQGKDYKPETFVDEHPLLTGAASLGLVPAFSAMMHQRELDRDNKKVRDAQKEHPFVTMGM